MNITNNFDEDTYWIRLALKADQKGYIGIEQSMAILNKIFEQEPDSN